MTIRKFFQALTFTGFIFSVLGFCYIAGNAWFHPETLKLPLTHFVHYPREDTFGALCFATGMICCFIYQLIKDDARPFVIKRNRQ